MNDSIEHLFQFNCKLILFQEDHEDINIQPVENPNFNFVPESEIMFHKKPKEPLVFRRGDAEPPQAVAELLPQEELLKKIKDRKAKKEKEENGNSFLQIINFSQIVSVEDFRELQKPDIEEADYKELDVSI